MAGKIEGCYVDLFGECRTPGRQRDKRRGARRIKMPWRTKHNKIDCGVFVMRHMETYKGAIGKNWDCGLANGYTDAGEISYKQRKEIDELRHKYVAKMLLSDETTYRDFVEADVAHYKKLSEDQKNDWNRQPLTQSLQDWTTDVPCGGCNNINISLFCVFLMR